MPKIMCVNPSGLFSYALHETVPLDNQNIVQLTGLNLDRLARDPNGSGKTSLLNAVCHIIFGECPVKAATDTSVVNHVWNKGCWGMVRFIGKNGSEYRVIMSRKWKGPYPDQNAETEPCELHDQGARLDGTDIYLDEWIQGKWCDRRKTKSIETRNAVIQAFGISYKQFITTSYLAQQTGLVLVTGTNKERMQIITELTDMSIWDRSVAALRERLKAKIQEQVGIEQNILGRQGALSALPIKTDDEIEYIKWQRAELQSQIESNIAQLDIIKAGVTALASQVMGGEDALVYAQQVLQSIREPIAQYTAKISTLVTERERSKAAIRPDNSAADKIRADVISYQTRYDILSQRFRAMMHGAGECDRCGTVVTTAHLAARKKEIADEMQSLQSVIEDAKSKIHDLTIQATQIAVDAIASVTARYNTEIGLLQHTLDLTKEQEKTYNSNVATCQNTLVQQRRDHDNQLRSQHQAEANIAQQRFNLSELDSTLQNIAQVAEAGAQIRADIAKLQESVSSLKLDQKVLNVCIKGMGDKGIKAHKFGTIIAVLNDIIKEYIAILTDGQVQVWLTPFKEKVKAKDADDITAEIQILVREGPKEEIDVGLYSGAERQQITLAIICAFWRLAMMQHGGTNVLFLDEIFGVFANNSADRVLSLLDKIRETHYGTIVVVTHSDHTKEQLQYDQLWTARKQNHITTLIRERA